MKRLARIIVRILIVTALVNGSLLMLSEDKITHRQLFEFSNMQGKMEDLGLFVKYWSTAVYTSVVQVSRDARDESVGRS
jgi:hypothetical protein